MNNTKTTTRIFILIYFVSIGFLSGLTNYFLGLVILFCLAIHFKFVFPSKILFISYWPIFLYLMFISLISQSTGPTDFMYFLKNSINFSNPIIFLTIGAMLSWVLDKKTMIKMILNVALLVSLLHIIYLAINISVFSSFDELRTTSGTQIDIVPLALAIVLFRKNFDLVLNKKIAVFYEIIFFAILLITFSRTMLIVFIIYSFIIIALSMNDDKRFLKIIKFFLYFLVIFGLFYLLIPDDIKTTFFNKILNSFQEVSSNNAWSDSTDVTHDWRGFENYSALFQFSNSSLMNKIFGRGIMDSIFVGIYSSLVGVSNGYLPYLHNGYFTLLLKGGFITLFYYIFFLLGNAFKHILYFKKYNKNSFTALPISILIGFFVTTYFTMGPFVRGISVWLLILLGYFSYSLKNSKDNILNKESEQ